MTGGYGGTAQGDDDSSQRDAAWADVHDPSSSSARLAEIGGHYPEFAPAIVAHPNCYPELEAWARTSGLLEQAPAAAAAQSTSRSEAEPQLAHYYRGSGDHVMESPIHVAGTVAEVHRTPLMAPTGHPAAPATLPGLILPTAAPAMSQGEVRLVLSLGLLGGVVVGVAINVWYWLLNNPLDSLLPQYPDGAGVRALLTTGVLAAAITSHGLFVGLLVRRQGVILATLALTLMTYFPVDWLATPILYPGYESPSLIDTLNTMLLYVGCGVLLVGVLGELLRGYSAKLPDSLLGRASIGLAVPVGWTLCFAVQLATGQGGWPDSFGPIDWITWLIGIAVLGVVFSGLIPAAVSGRWIPFTDVPVLAPRAPASPGYAASVPAAVSLAAAGGTGKPDADGLHEHPKATQVLMFALLGLFVFAPLAIAAWVTGAKARAEMAQNPGRYRPSSSLQAGYVIGIVGTLIWAAGIVLLLALFGWLWSLR